MAQSLHAFLCRIEFIVHSLRYLIASAYNFSPRFDFFRMSIPRIRGQIWPTIARQATFQILPASSQALAPGGPVPEGEA